MAKFPEFVGLPVAGSKVVQVAAVVVVRIQRFSIAAESGMGFGTAV